MAAIQSAILNPELSEPHMLGPGATLTDKAKDELNKKMQRLADARKNGEFADTGKWSLLDLPEIQNLLSARRFRAELTPDPRDTWVGFPEEEKCDPPKTSVLEAHPHRMAPAAWGPIASKTRRTHYIPDDIDACERNIIG